MTRITLSLVFLLLCFNVTSALPQRAVMDFDGDNKSDYAVIRLNAGVQEWYLQRSTEGFRAQSFGGFSDQFIPGDYDGDLKWDIATWRPGTPSMFYIFQSQTNTLRQEPFGVSSDSPRITQDFDGDGKVDLAVTRNVDGVINWYIQRSQLGITYITFGNTGDDVPIRGDFDGDGKADVAVYRFGGSNPGNAFLVLRSSDGNLQGRTFGNFSTGDQILPGDFDGDGKTDYAFYRSGGTWQWHNSSNGSSGSLAFGATGDRPAIGDYDGDGKADQSVWRPATPSTFYINRSALGFLSFQFGGQFDQIPAFTLQARTIGG